jgi:hypothetical protein
MRLSPAAVAALAWSAASAADFAVVPDPTLTSGAVRTTGAAPAGSSTSTS